MSVVIGISHIYSHRITTGVHQAGIGQISECSILLVDIQVIVFMKIVTDINVRVSIGVDVAYHKPEPISDSSSSYAACSTDICEFVAVIFEKAST